MSTTYNNIPQEKTQSSSDATLMVFDQYYQAPVELNNNDLVVMKGFFQSRGFDDLSAEITALTILTQAKKDDFNALQIIDTLSGLNNIEISGLVAEIVNYNRYKTSAIGTSQFYAPSEEVVRNILP